MTTRQRPVRKTLDWLFGEIMSRSVGSTGADLLRAIPDLLDQGASAG